MFCIGCGHKLTAVVKFCPQCGALQTSDEVGKAAAPAVPAAAPPPPPAPAQITAAPSPEQAIPDSAAPDARPSEQNTSNAHAAPSGASSGASPNANFGSQPQGGGNTIIVVSHAKSLPLAIILALFFGPLGMLYSTVKGAVIMFFVSFVVGVLTALFGLFITIPIGVIWAAMATNAHNAALMAGATRQ